MQKQATPKRFHSLAAICSLVIAAGFYFSWLLTSSATAAPAGCTVPSTPPFISKLGFYVLAYDNPDEATYNLADKYQATVDRLVTATAVVPDSVVVILADLGAADDTHIVVATGGVATTINCLPNSDQELDANIKEYDVTDGETLANFLLWGQAAFSPYSSKVFSYIGHGNPVTPYSNPAIAELVTDTVSTVSQSIQTVNALSPLPTRLDANPSFTDHHAPGEGELGLITPYALQVALSRATNNGAGNFSIVDLLHCFAASIDELYEVAPYTAGIVASPNYAFFDPTMPGISFELGTPEDIIAAYHNLHPPTEHPHIIMGIEADTIVSIVDAWNDVSQELMKEYNANPDQTTDKLLTAYRESVKYDTTVCDADGDWALEPPDALSDMLSFATELQTAYSGANPALNNALSSTIGDLEGSILSTASQNGVPYFDQEDPSQWQFLPGDSGVSLWTPFETTNISGTEYLPWQSLWYTSTLVYTITNNIQIGNPQPFRFIEDSATPIWADVVARFWVEQSMRPGVDVDTFFCTSELIALKDDALSESLIYLPVVLRPD